MTGRSGPPAPTRPPRLSGSSLSPARRHARRSGLALAILCAVQALLGLDMTICNVALPNISRALQFGGGDGLAWVVDGYSLSYAGLLLAGGRLADLAGPRAVLAAGMTLFAAASGAAAIAPTAQLLIAARIAQGGGAALAAPSSLSLVTRTTPAGRVHRALAAYAAAGGAGAAAGQLAGGVIIAAAGWRWVLLVNVPAGLLLAAGALSVVPAAPPRARASGLDLPGTLAGTGALLCLVFGALQAGDRGWGSPSALIAFEAAAALAVIFASAELGTRRPLVPPELLRSRERLAAYLTGMLTYAWMYPVLYMLTQIMQDVHGWSALRCGLYWLPTGLGTIAGGLLIARPLARRLPAPVILGASAMVLAVASAWLAWLTPHAGYLVGMLPAFAVGGLALGVTLAVNMPRAAVGAGPSAGVAAGLLGTCQQTGAAVSLAAAAAVASSSTRRSTAAWAGSRHAATRAALAAASVHGFAVALSVTAAIAACAVVVQFADHVSISSWAGGAASSRPGSTARAME